ncbi:MAG: carbon starvation protein CstA [Acidobacteria bacterium RIFCSPLOWO2_02_FULL_65_29]|nr:MAG: carbon starvation protein CstA [Acidobacteria bacterium RIFCSPLOWO2_02_FULL_65_29]
MHALYLVVPALAIMAIAYRYYSAFIAAKVMALDDSRVTPAHSKYDGHNYYPTTRWVLFGHHFAAITGAGPLVGPTLAAQFGYAPGFIWLVAGCCLAGAVHDVTVLWGSTRRGGRSLADIARTEISPVAGTVGAIAVLFIVIIALAGLGIVVVNALAESAWGTFTIGMTIPLAIFMGFYMFRWRKGQITQATIGGVIGMILCVILGERVAASALAPLFILSHHQLTFLLAAYGFAASVLPVWMLLTPRDYLSTYMKIGTIALLVIGVIVVNPVIQAPALSQYVGGGGPIIPGPLFPFVFITIACGAISGFHGLIGTGTTPKMVDKESDVRPIGFGAMLCEGVVGVMALIAATSLHPGDYYAINTPPAVFENLKDTAGASLAIVNLADLQVQVGENVVGRPGGGVSLAIGMADIFSSLPGMRGLMAYWYHFAIMFEALFILTTIDAGTRVARFALQEFIGRAWKPFGQANWLPGSIASTAFICFSFGYFIWTGSIDTIWPMFGVANQLLASVGLAVGTTILINMGRAKYMWVTFVPLCFVATTTLTAGFMNVRDNYWPKAIGPNPALHVQGYVNSICTSIMMVLAVILIVSATRRCVAVFQGKAAALAQAEG